MRRMVLVFGVSGILITRTVMAAAGAAGTPSPQHEAHSQDAARVYEGPQLTLAAAIQEAQAKNPDLIVLRQQIDVMRQRPAQERALG